MSRPRLAIVGTGIAGLSAAWFLRERYALTLFERADYLGGHTNTIDVTERGEQVAFDTGFMVFNRVTYPNLCRFFAELQVPVKPTDMSFSVQHVPRGLEFCGSSLNHLFAQRKNLLRPSFYRLLLAINRFNAEAVPALTDPRWADTTVGDYVRERGYGDDFLGCYLVPMSSAVWSTPPDLMLEFPAVTLLRFFHNHGFLGLSTQHPWWTVDGGAREYVRRLRPLLQASGAALLANSCVTRVTRPGAGGAAVTTVDGTVEYFDRVILACHGDQALRLLAEADPDERRLLGEFRYQPNLATVHTDAAMMPRSRLAWSAWNYRIAAGPHGGTAPQTVYWMNRLQGVSDRENYFVSVNGEASVNPAKIIRQIAYEHPLFSRGAIRAQAELPALNRRAPGQAVYFAGSYFRYGFHEDAFTSGLDCARAVSGERLWD
ncbi:MAG TPA: FAD-dependent oxidoreductase [Candidatus Limnocylindria bacterium]|nr:FAD-dependent oxidoreductase [Candidatus Limnocylindria bacterium]